MRMCFVVFMLLLLIMYFAIILLDVVIFYLFISFVCGCLTQCGFVRIQWYYRLVRWCCWMFFLCIFCSFYFRFYCFHCFSQSLIWISFFYVVRAKFQGSMFCLEVNQWQVTEEDVPVLSAEGRLAQVLLCLGVCFMSLNSVKQEWDDDSWFLCQSSFLLPLGSLCLRTK